MSVHLSVRPCFCLCACAPVVGRAACFLRLRPTASPPSSPSIKPSDTSLAFVGNTSSSMSACADFGHPTHPGPHRFSHPAKSKFFSFLSDSEGNGKKLDLPPRPKGVAGALKTPKQNASQEPIDSANPPPVLQFRSFSPYPAPRKNNENCKSVRPAVPPLKF